jgi:hypothetical protein
VAGGRTKQKKPQDSLAGINRSIKVSPCPDGHRRREKRKKEKKKKNLPRKTYLGEDKTNREKEDNAWKCLWDIRIKRDLPARKRRRI